jgi:hypothetical protein
MKDVKSQEEFIQTIINGYRLFVLATIFILIILFSRRLCGRRFLGASECAGELLIISSAGTKLIE